MIQESRAKRKRDRAVGKRVGLKIFGNGMSLVLQIRPATLNPTNDLWITLH